MLGIPWGVVAQVSGSGTFKEGWTLRWEPEFSVRVVEASLHGNTVVRAANTVASSKARRARELSDLSALLEVTRLANLPDAARLTLGILDVRAADADVAELLGALPPLARLVRYGDVRTRPHAHFPHDGAAGRGRTAQRRPRPVQRGRQESATGYRCR